MDRNNDFSISSDEVSGPAELLLAAALLLRMAAVTRPRIPPASSGLAPWQVRTLATHLETNLDKPIRSSELASVVRLDPAYFCRAFRASFGEPPLQYVSRRRIERAQQLMLSTHTSLSQIAFDCGFADQAHFSRSFRRVAGDTPRAWRREHAGSAADAAHARPEHESARLAC